MRTPARTHSPARTMIPLKLSLKNFLSYGENPPTLDFGSFSIACLSGRNGHGKSALLDAITWALWGQCRAPNKEEVIRRGASSARVELEFEAEGVHYRVIRGVRRTPGGKTASTADLQRFDPSSGEFKSHQTGRQVNAEIASALKMDFDSFICSSFILQGRADEFMKKTPAERKEVLATVLHLDRYNTYARVAREKASGAKAEGVAEKARIGEVEEEIGRKEELTTALEGCRERLGGVEKRVEELDAARSGMFKRSEALKAKVARHAGLVSQGEGLASQIDDARGRLSTVEGDIEKAQAVVERRDEITEGYGRYSAATKLLEGLNERLGRQGALTEGLSAARSGIQAARAEIEKKLGALEGSKRELTRTIDAAGKLIDRKEEIEEGHGRYLEAAGEERGMEERRHVHEALYGRRTELEGRLRAEEAGLRSRADELQAKARGLGKKLESREGLEGEIRGLERDIAALAEKQVIVKTVTAELKDISEEMRAIGERIAELGRRGKEEKEKLSLVESELDDPHCPLCESTLGVEAKSALVEKLRAAVSTCSSDENAGREDHAGLQGKQKRLKREIEGHEDALAALGRLNASLGGKRSAIKELTASEKELTATMEKIAALDHTLETGDFGSTERAELEGVLEGIKTNGYDPKHHTRLRKQLATLGKYLTRKELLERAVEDMERAGKERGDIDAEATELKALLDGRRFAEDLFAEEKKLLAGIEEVGYDPKEHGRVRTELEGLMGFDDEKKSLDRALLSLEHLGREREEMSGRLAGLELEARKLAKEISGLSASVEEGGQVERELEALVPRLQGANEERDGVLGQISRHEAGLERISGLEKRRAQMRKRLDKLEREHKIYYQLSRAFGKNGIQALIIENAVPEIEHEANNILRKLTDGTLTLSMELVQPTQSGGEKETLQIRVGDSSGTRSYETYSGGETFRIDFALRVAISKFIASSSGADLRTLVVDEGFGTQDREGLQHFVEVMNSIKDDFDKILVITHIEELKDKFPVRIEVTKDYGTGSTFEVTYN